MSHECFCELKVANFNEWKYPNKSEGIANDTAR